MSLINDVLILMGYYYSRVTSLMMMLMYYYYVRVTSSPILLSFAIKLPISRSYPANKQPYYNAIIHTPVIFSISPESRGHLTAFYTLDTAIRYLIIITEPLPIKYTSILPPDSLHMTINHMYWF